MYRVNVYARCTAIKMTGGLSYCLHIVAAISLHIGSSPTAARYDSSNLTEITDSRQFRQNMEVSKHRDNPHWLENYKYKPLKHQKVEKRPFWESNVVPGPWTNDLKNQEIQNWEGMMRKVTGERLKKWSTRGVKGKFDSGMNNSDTEEILQNHQQQSESIEIGTENSENSENTDSEHGSTTISEDSGNSAPTEKPIKNLPKKEEFLKETMLPYRWGMSKNRPPDHVLKQILNNDIHKLHKNSKIQRENEANDDNDDDDDDDDDEKGNNGISMRIASDNEHDESNGRLNSKSDGEQTKTPKNSLRIKINDTTTQLPMLSSETTQSDPLETADSSKNTYEKNLDGIDAIYGTGIRRMGERPRIFSPIIVLGPTIYVADLPKGIKQKLKIHRPMNAPNRIQSPKIMKDDIIQSKEHSQSNDPDFSGVYEFY